MTGLVKLQCELCRGPIQMQAGGRIGKCSYCGMEYTWDRLNEMVGKSSVTGNKADIEQWKKLLEKYLSNGDYEAALTLSRKILEAAPDDEYANSVYQKLLRRAHEFVINDKDELVRYEGTREIVIVPEGVKCIKKLAFCNSSGTRKLIFPDSLEEIEDCIFYDWATHTGNDYSGESIEEIKFGNNLKKIEYDAFSICLSVHWLVLPDSIEFLAKSALPLNLEVLKLPLSYKGFADCCEGNSTLIEVNASEEFINDLLNKAPECPFCVKERENRKVEEVEKGETTIYTEREEWIKNNRCQYCGGSFRGLFGKTCVICGKRKDY